MMKMFTLNGSNKTQSEHDQISIRNWVENNWTSGGKKKLHTLLLTSGKSDVMKRDMIIWEY